MRNKISNFLVILFLTPFLCARADTSLSKLDPPPIYAGDITKVAVNQFIEKYNTANIDGIIIASAGGDAEAGMILGEWVFDRKLDVQTRTICASACANYVFLAGKRKIISKFSVVMWHGSMEQKDIREAAEHYEELLRRYNQKEALSENDKEYLKARKASYEGSVRLRARQKYFYKKIGIDEYITRIGQEPVKYISDNWTMTKDAMGKFGVTDIEVPDGYASDIYMQSNFVANNLNKGSMLVFDIDSEGGVRPIRNFTVSDK